LKLKLWINTAKEETNAGIVLQGNKQQPANRFKKIIPSLMHL